MTTSPLWETLPSDHGNPNLAYQPYNSPECDLTYKIQSKGNLKSEAPAVAG